MQITSFGSILGQECSTWPNMLKLAKYASVLTGDPLQAEALGLLIASESWNFSATESAKIGAQKLFLLRLIYD